MLTRLFVLLALLSPNAAMAASQGATTAAPCAGAHPASEQEAASCGLKVGDTVCAGTVCTADAGAAKDYLYSIAKDLRNSCAPPTDRKNIDRLNNAFAICAEKFLRAYTTQYGPVNVVSAFRDGAKGTAIDGSGRSANECAGGAGNSKHMAGIAMDINPAGGNSSYETLKSEATKYGVYFPWPFYNGSTDKAHMQPSTKECGAGANVDTTYSGDTGAQQSGAIAQGLRSLFTPAQQPITQQPAIQATPMTQQPVSQAFNQPATTPASTGLQPAPAPVVASKGDALIDAIANPDTKNGSTSPPKVIINGSDTGGLSPVDVNADTRGQVGIGLSTAQPQQTFVSADLAMTPSVPTPATRLAYVLELLKTALVKLKTLFTPFGGGTRNVHTTLAQDEYAE